MTARDGFPVDLDDHRRELKDQALSSGHPPVVVARRHTCGCRLGEVHRVPAGTVLLVYRLARVRGEVRSQCDVVDLDDVPNQVDLSCLHGGCLLVDEGVFAAGDVATFRALRDVVSGARNAKTTFVI